MIIASQKHKMISGFVGAHDSMPKYETSYKNAKNIAVIDSHLKGKGKVE